MTDLQRRLADLEKRARRVKPASPVTAGELAAGLHTAWADLDAGTFSGSEYHARALVTLRDALETTGAENGQS